MTKTSLEIIISRVGRKDQVRIGGPVKGQGIVVAEYEGMQADRIILTDLRNQGTTEPAKAPIGQQK